MLRWLFLATLSAILLLQLRGLDEPLRTPETPRGIVGFELAGTRAEADRMLGAWRTAGVLEAAKVSLGVDMGFLLAYPFFLRSTVGLLRRRVRPGRLARGGDWLARAVLVCGPLDLAENLLLWRMVDAGLGLAVVPQSHAAQARHAVVRPLQGALAFSRRVGLSCDATDIALQALLAPLAATLNADRPSPHHQAA